MYIDIRIVLKPTQMYHLWQQVIKFFIQNSAAYQALSTWYTQLLYWLQFQSKSWLNLNYSPILYLLVAMGTSTLTRKTTPTIILLKNNILQRQMNLFLPDHVSGGVQQLAIFIHITLNHQVAIGVMGWEVVSHHSAGDTQGSRHWQQMLILIYSSRQLKFITNAFNVLLLTPL